MLNINEAAKYLGVSVNTLRRWEREGKITAARSAGGHRRYEEKQLASMIGRKKQSKLTVGYCRVSSHVQKEDLSRQVERVSSFCIAKGYQFKIIEDLGSGLNFHKKGLKDLITLICTKEVERIVINYKDRLVRFGYEMIEQLCDIHNVEIELINHTDDKTYEQELVEDVLSVVTVFSAKLYGSRSHKTKKIEKESKNLFGSGIVE
jgi:excisionase family DNA binding protein